MPVQSKFQTRIFEMRQLGSMLTGQIVAKKNPTEAGSNAGRTGSALSLADTQRVAAWLARQSPADMDKAAVSRASSHGVGLRVRYESRYPSGPNGERLPSYDVAVGCDIGGTPDGIAAALADLRNFMTPAPAREIEGWLAELSVIVARRADDAFADELRVAAYASRLGRYPADVVRLVLLGQTYRFWPTWEELEKRCEAMTGPRRHMIAALERGHEPKEPDRRPPTDAERDRVSDLVNELFPDVSWEMRPVAADEAQRGNCMAGPALGGDA